MILDLINLVFKAKRIVNDLDEKERAFHLLDDKLSHSEDYLFSQRDAYLDKAVALRRNGLDKKSQKRAYLEAVNGCIRAELKLCRLTETFDEAEKISEVRDGILAEIRREVELDGKNFK